MILDEQETIIRWGRTDDSATVSTTDTNVIAKWDKLAESDNRICVSESKDGYREYSFPLKALRVKLSKKINDAERKRLAEQGRRNLFGRCKEVES